MPRPTLRRPLRLRSRITVQRALQSFADPPGPDELICQARGSRGGNKVDVMLPDGYHALVILPAKFRKQIWIRKGGFVIVQVTRDEEDEEGQRSFNGEIVRVLLKDDEKHLRALEGGTHWPERWCITDGDGDGDGYGDGYGDDRDDRDNRDDRDGLPCLSIRCTRESFIDYVGELLAPCFVRQFCGMDETAHTEQKILTKLMNSAAR